MADQEQKNPRLVLRNFLSFDQCKELEFIHKSSCTVGYRPNVFSTTLSHLIATNSAHLIMPLIVIREKLKEKVEEFFGCEFELCIEFTGLVSWSKGASIGWHSDDNRPYLKQRDFTAVCYLNSYEKDFRGGLFRFQDGEPVTFMPYAGDALIYTADNRNVHAVDEVIEGERLTLTLWFSRKSSHDEDVKLVSRLFERYSSHTGLNLPLPAPSSMYEFSPVQSFSCESAINICCARIYALGYGIYSPEDKTNSLDMSDLLSKPLQLTRCDEIYCLEFENVLHALQVVQYYSWKGSDLRRPAVQSEERKVIPLSQSQRERVKELQLIFGKDQELMQMTLCCMNCDNCKMHKEFDWTTFSSAVMEWEDYSSKLHRNLIRSLPHWRTHQSIFDVTFDEV